MSTLHIEPGVDTWRTRLEPFIASFLAYDVDYKRISNKQFYIEYDITYDGSIPDLSNAKTQYSNKDGVIEFHFDKPCRISAVAYMVKNFDETISIDSMGTDYESKEICTNLLLPFQPFITSFDAIYTSEEAISVNDEIPRKYIQVTVTYSDTSIKTYDLIDKPDHLIDPEKIPYTGDVTATISYHDPLLDVEWKSKIFVRGKVQELSISATYIGDTKYINNLIPKSLIIVKIELFDGYTKYTELLDNDAWNFTSLPQITNVNLGVLEIEHNKLRCNVRIPFYWLTTSYRLDAWYEGPPVECGESFVPEYFRIYLYYDTGLRAMLKLEECHIEPEVNVIKEPGLNWFTISYRIDDFTIKDKVAILGYVEKVYPELDFKMEYYNKNTHSLEDVTEKFNETCMIGKVRYFKWSKICDRITEMMKFGVFRLYAPVLTGLSTKCPTVWMICCFNKNSIKASLVEMIEEEEEDNTNGTTKEK